MFLVTIQVHTRLSTFNPRGKQRLVLVQTGHASLKCVVVHLHCVGIIPLRDGDGPDPSFLSDFSKSYHQVPLFDP